MQIPKALDETYEHLKKTTNESIFLSRAPGRVEILGNHTDYNGGLVLATTIDRYVWTLGHPSSYVTLYSMNYNKGVSFQPNVISPFTSIDWTAYLRGVYWAFKSKDYKVKGITGAVYGDVPRGGGLSSSAAYEVSLVNLIAEISELDLQPEELAAIAYKAEREYCGVSCGIMDQYTSQLGKPDSLLMIDCASLRTDSHKVSEMRKFVIIDSKISRAAGHALNTRRSECDRALKILNTKGWSIANLSEIELDDLEKIETNLSNPLSKRVRHVIQENKRVEEGIIALGQNDFDSFGEIMTQSHRSSRDLYEVSHPNLDLLVDLSLEIPGVKGARLTGAGFGGAIVALVDVEYIEEYATQIEREYYERTDLHPQVYTFSIPGGVKVEQISQ